MYDEPVASVSKVSPVEVEIQRMDKGKAELFAVVKALEERLIPVLSGQETEKGRPDEVNKTPRAVSALTANLRAHNDAIDEACRKLSGLISRIEV